MISTHTSEVISFYSLTQDTMFPTLNLFDILINSSILLTCVSRCASISALVFSYNSCCQIGIIGSAVFWNFDGIGATDSACTEVFLLMASSLHTKKKAGFNFVEIYEVELIWYC